MVAICSRTENRPILFCLGLLSQEPYAMSDTPEDAGWERWRGEMTSTMSQVLKEIRKLGAQFESHEMHDDNRFAKVSEDHASLKTQVAWWAGAAAAIGSAIGWAINVTTGKQP